MSVPTIFSLQKNVLINSGLKSAENIHYQQRAEELKKQIIARGEEVLINSGSLEIKTGKNIECKKFIVKNDTTSNSGDWKEFTSMKVKHFDELYKQVLAYLDGKEIWIRDCYASTDHENRLKIRVMNENPSANLFAYQMFHHLKEEELENFKPDWHLIQTSSFTSKLKTEGIKQGNFLIINFISKIILASGACYTDEMKNVFKFLERSK